MWIEIKVSVDWIRLILIALLAEKQNSEWVAVGAQFSGQCILCAQDTVVHAMTSDYIREAFKNYFFEHIDFPLRGGEYPPIPLRKKSAKKQLFLAKKRLF